MKRFKTELIYLSFILFLCVFLIPGCGGGGGEDSAAPAIPGGGGGSTPLPAAPIIPGAVCSITGPTVTSSSPTSGNQLVTISTADVPGGGKKITAAFSEAMDPLTITSVAPGALSTFTLKEKVAGTTVSGTVAMNSGNTVATFTTSAALDTSTEYTATITKDARSAGGTALGCSYEWSFKTGTSLAAGQAQVDLGTSAPYGIFASADADVTLQNPSTLVVGDVGLMDGAGACFNCDATTVTGTINNGNAAAAQAQADFTAAYADAATRATGLCTLANNTEIAGPQGACAGYAAPPGSIGPDTHHTYLPGLYWSASTIDLGVGQTITLDAQNDADAVFIFQAGSAITTGTDSIILLANGAKANNVWWMAGTATTLGVSSQFKGTVLANGAAVSVLNGTALSPTLVEGRLFSRGAAATVDTFATITVPAP